MRYTIREPDGPAYGEADGFREAVTLLHEARDAGQIKAVIYYKRMG